MHIEIKKGLDIPIKGRATGHIQELSKTTATTHCIALDLTSFQDMRLKLLTQAGAAVKIGQPLVEDKNAPGRFFVAPAGGTVREIRRGLKRALVDIIIDVADVEQQETFPRLQPSKCTQEEIIAGLKAAGLFANIRSRPFNLLADPHKAPRAIFVKGLESAPFAVPVELQLKGLEREFQVGLDLLACLTRGSVHLVFAADSTFKPLVHAERVEKHTASGPHPISNASLHIQRICPIRSAEDIIWTVSAAEVASIGYLAMHGTCHVTRCVAIAGPAILPGKTGFFKVRQGCSLSTLLAGRLPDGPLRLISGTPLTGQQVQADGFLGFTDSTVCAIAENTQRQFMHFFRLGIDKYSFSKAYLSGHLKGDDYFFTTNQHGEHRAFIDSTLYDKVMPLDVSTMLLVKAVLAEDFDLAKDLGLLEVDSEDFALPTFVCPSKMEMTEIIKAGLKKCAAEVYAT